MVKTKIRVDIVALSELPQVSKQRKRMKERPEETKKVWDAQK